MSGLLMESLEGRERRGQHSDSNSADCLKSEFDRKHEDTDEHHHLFSILELSEN